MDHTSTRTAPHTSAGGAADAMQIPAQSIAQPPIAAAPHDTNPGDRCPDTDAVTKQLGWCAGKSQGAVTPLQLPTDRPRQASQSHTVDRVYLKLPTALTKRLRNLAKQNHVSLFSTLLGGWAILLGRWSGQEEVLIGTPTSRLQRSAEIDVSGRVVENVIAFRIEVHGRTPIGQLLRHVESTVSEARMHSNVSLDETVAALWPHCATGPLLPIVVDLEEAPPAQGAEELQLLQLLGGIAEKATRQFGLTLVLNDVNGHLRGTFEYACDLFERETIERMALSWRELLHGMVKHVRRPIGQLGLLTAMERQRVLYLNNDTAAPYSKERLVHELVEAQVRRTPEAIAVEHEGQSLTYAELNRRANQLARSMRDRGVTPGQLVAIGLERSVAMIVGLLAILKSGAAYVPLDPNYPAERLAQMMEDASPALVLTQSSLRTALPLASAEVIELDTEASLPEGFSADNLGRGADSSQDASRVYVIFTSGSTGRPKGVEMAHSSMVNLIEWHRRSFSAREGTRVLQFAALSFDVAFQEIFTTLCTGGSLVLIDEWIRRDARALLQMLNARLIQRWFVPPLVLQSVAEYAKSSGATAPSLQDIVTAGEQLRITPEIIRFFTQLQTCRLHNHYGPTETHVVTALTLLPRDAATWPLLPSIGRPIANTQIYILDAQLQLVPTGVAGEIYIGGANVARGYLNRAELTTQRFIIDPFGGDANARLYKTGDLGMWRADGTVEYLGRNDDQVKIRGFRIELGEIEAQLAGHAQVKEAAVVAREESPGLKSLVAYVTLRPGSEPSVAELRAHVTEKLPEYMIPSAFVVLDALPMTPSGKLDRRRLPAPQLSAYVSREYEPPQGGLEETLAAIWQSLLRVPSVGRRDNFFELGGDSLLMARMMEALREAGLSVDARTAFQSQSLAALASQLSSAETAPDARSTLPLVELTADHRALIAQSVPGGSANIQDIYPLAPLQEGLLFHHLVSAGQGDTYVIPTLLSVASRSRLDALIAAVQAVINRHDALRTAVQWEQMPKPVQVVYRQAQLPVDTVVLDPTRDALEQVQAWLEADRQSLDLRCAPLMRLQIAADPHGERWYVLLQLHHIIGDNTSQEILSAEIEAHLRDDTSQLPDPLPYRHHVAHALSRARECDAEAFFRSKLHDVEEATEPFGWSNVRVGGAVEEAHHTLDDAFSSRVRAQARRLGTTPATLFHAAWALVAAHSSGREDVVFGTVLLGRFQGDADAQQMLGMSINTLPLRLRLQGVTARELVQLTHLELSELLSYEHASLAEAQRCSGIEGSGALFTSLLNYRHYSPRAGAEWIRADGIRVLAHSERTNYPITLSVDDLGNAFALTGQTVGGVAPGRVVEYAATAVHSLLVALEGAARTQALELSILPEVERRQILDSFNATERPYPRSALIHELFEIEATRRPDAVAVVYEGQRLSYAELNAQANQLARYLIAQGMQPGEYVPVIEERNLRLIVAQLAVLKAGAAYVPMDPKLPEERQAFMIRDCAARRVLGTGARTMATTDEGFQWIDLAGLESSLRDLPTANPAVSLSTPASAYVMYTSGSTGVPKGVVVPHHGVLRLVINCDYANFVEQDCIAHCSNPMFDASTLEVWAALLHGATLVVAPQSTVLDVARLSALLIKERVSILWMTIGLFTQYADALGEVFSQLRYLMTGGDVVDPEVVRRVLRRSRPEHFLNAYGPTESTTFTTTYEIQSINEDAASLPIGRPIANTTTYILDRFRQPVPIGVAGELYIGGDGVALGYLNRAELTAQRFTADPFSTKPGALLYGSGDLARWREDGNIEFLGRNDQQIKLRGYRIELGEIEALLSRHPRVKEAVVVVGQDATANKCLVAYVVPSSSEALSAAELREYLLAELPEHMAPSATVVLERLPLTANGKLDRRALPAPTIDAYMSRAYEPPRGDTEELIAKVWQELLRLERVGRNDAFFELGGHSLLAMQVMVRLRSLLGIELSINTLFEFPTLRELAAQVELLRDERLFDQVAGGGDDIEALLEQVATMSESNVNELMQQFRSGGR